MTSFIAPLITVERLVELHCEAIEKYGGDTSPPRLDCFAGCIGNAHNATLYASDDDLVDPLIFAGYLVYYLARNHCAVDGNKRIAWMAMADVLLTSESDIDATTDEAVDFILSIVGRERDVPAVIEWIATRLIDLR